MEHHPSTAPEVSSRDVSAQWRASAARAAGRAYEAAYGREVRDDARGLRWRIEPRVAVTVVVALAVLGLFAWWGMRGGHDAGTPGMGAGQPSAVPTVVTTRAGAAEAPVESDALVQVSGEVAEPGLVEVPAGSRIADAVEAAGGLTARADLAAINLARVAADGEHVHVPAEGEAEPGDRPVSLNAATAEELETLPGVGPVLAQRLVADREANGPFASVDDAQRVSGVGPAMVAGWEGLAQV